MPKPTALVRRLADLVPDARNAVTFLASFPPIQSAIKVGQDGMRIQFDVPETEMGNAVLLLAMREKVLKITVEVVEQPPINQKPVAEKKSHYEAMSGRKG